VLGALLVTALGPAGATGDETSIVPGDVRCPSGQAIVSGPPARELFDPYTPQSGTAVWCEQYDDLGRPSREGPYRDYHPDGQDRTFAHFRDDRLEGPVLILHANGRPWLHTFYHEGRLHGPYVAFAATGEPWLEAWYEEGQPVGRHVVYHPGGGIAALTYYRGGKEHGTSRAWYPNGQLRQEIEVVAGVWSGQYTSWYENGQFESRGQYAPCPPEIVSSACTDLGSARHGRWRTWHVNGSQASEGTWRYGERVGEWLYWTSAGEPTSADVTTTVESTDEDPPPASPAQQIVTPDSPAVSGTSLRLRLRD
jgi:antitoxin component YwqK of YwqJK toxin-antitoxin module